MNLVWSDLDGIETVSGMAALYGVDRVTMHRALKRAAAMHAAGRQPW